MAVAIPVIIAAIRYRVGTDYNAYILIYNDMHKFSLADYLSSNIHGIEFGYFVLIKLRAYFVMVKLLCLHYLAHPDSFILCYAQI